MSKGPLKLCILSGSFEYDSESSLTIFRDYVEREYPVSADLIVYSSEDDHQSLSAIEETDVLLVFTRRLNTAGEELTCDGPVFTLNRVSLDIGPPPQRTSYLGALGPGMVRLVGEVADGRWCGRGGEDRRFDL